MVTGYLESRLLGANLCAGVYYMPVQVRSRHPINTYQIKEVLGYVNSQASGVLGKQRHRSHHPGRGQTRLNTASHSVCGAIPLAHRPLPPLHDTRWRQTCEAGTSCGQEPQLEGAGDVGRLLLTLGTTDQSQQSQQGSRPWSPRTGETSPSGSA